MRFIEKSTILTIILKFTYPRKLFSPNYNREYLMNEFFHLKKKYFAFKLFRFLCFWWMDKFQYLWRHQWHYCIRGCTFNCIFRFLDSIRMKFGRILIYSYVNIRPNFILMLSRTNISNLFLLLLWRLKTSSTPV